MGDTRRTFLLESLIDQGTVEELFLFRLPPRPCAIKIKSAQIRLVDLSGVAILGKALVSGRADITLTYVDDDGQVRVAGHREPVSVIIPLAEVQPDMRIIPSAQVQDQVVELIDPCEVLIKATATFTALATECVIIKNLCPREVTIAKRGFFKAEEEHTTTDAFLPSIVRDVSDKATYTFFVRNTGLANSAEVQLEISPDGLHWQPDSILFSLAPLANVAVTPRHFLRSARLVFRSAVVGQPTQIHIWFQAQA